MVAAVVAGVVVLGMSGCGGGDDPNVLACQAWGGAFHGGGGVDVHAADVARDGAVGVVATAMRRAVDHPDATTFVSVQRVCRDAGVTVEYPE